MKCADDTSPFIDVPEGLLESITILTKHTNAFFWDYHVVGLKIDIRG